MLVGRDEYVAFLWTAKMKIPVASLRHYKPGNGVEDWTGGLITWFEIIVMCFIMMFQIMMDCI